MKNQGKKKAVVASPKEMMMPLKKQNRKNENPVRIPIITEPCSDFNCSSSWVCENSSCRATVSTEDTFCRRCACCICHMFDDNKDPSLWLECASETATGGQRDHCGLSCHIECALKREKVGVVDLGQSMQLDGSFCCPSCGKVSGILGCLKKQLNMGKEARRVDVLCHRILLCYRLLAGTTKFKQLHELIEEAKSRLETEVGPIDDVVSAKLARGIVSGLSVAGDVHTLCSLAIEKADELLATRSRTTPRNQNESLLPSVSRELDLNVASVPDLNEEPIPMIDSFRDEEDNECTLVHDAVEIDDDVISHDLGGKIRSHGSGDDSRNTEVVAVESNGKACRKRVATGGDLHDSDSTLINGSPLRVCNGSGCLDENFEECVKIIRWLECEGYIEKVFRLKLLTWFSLRSTEQERRVVNTFIQTLIDDPSSLAGQLFDSFSEIVSCKRQRNGFSSMLWH